MILSDPTVLVLSKSFRRSFISFCFRIKFSIFWLFWVLNKQWQKDFKHLFILRINNVVFSGFNLICTFNLIYLIQEELWLIYTSCLPYLFHVFSLMVWLCSVLIFHRWKAAGDLCLLKLFKRSYLLVFSDFHAYFTERLLAIYWFGYEIWYNCIYSFLRLRKVYVHDSFQVYVIKVIFKVFIIISFKLYIPFSSSLMLLNSKFKRSV